MNTHSLRIGGASALYAATRSEELVRRWGRWRSEVYSLYIWDERSTISSDARRMVEAGSDYIAYQDV